MSVPRDRHEHNRTGLVKAARLFSNIVSPPVIFAVVGFLVALKAAPPLEAILWASVYGLMVSLGPILFVVWLLHTGRVKELHMSDTRERHLPYLVAVVSALIVYGLLLLVDGPPLMKCLAIFNALTLALLGIINAFWLISFHATAVAAATAIIYLLYGGWLTLVAAVFVVLVIIVRLYLKRHTPAQVVAGLALGFGTVWLLTQFGCFV